MSKNKFKCKKVSETLSQKQNKKPQTPSLEEHAFNSRAQEAERYMENQRKKEKEKRNFCFMLLICMFVFYLYL